MKYLALIALVFAASCGAPPASQPAAPAFEPSGEMTISEAWAAATPGGVDVSAGYLSIANQTGDADALIAVSSPRAERAEVHEMTMDGAVMRMRAMPRLDLPADASIALAPGGMHLMFYGVAEPFVEGQTIPVTLTFERAGAVAVELPVRRGRAHSGGH